MDANIIEFVEANSTDYTIYKQFIRLNNYLQYRNTSKGYLPYFIKDISNIDNYYNVLAYKVGTYDANTRDKFNRYFNATRSSQKRCHKRLEKMLLYASLYNYNVIFVTFTFDNETMDNTSADTKRRYVTRYLSGQENVIDYYGNEDYGELNNRLHFHAVVLVSGSLDYSSWSTKYGAIKGKRVPLEKCNTTALSKYIIKLDKHAVKLATNGHNKLSCRKTRYDDFMRLQEIREDKPTRKHITRITDDGYKFNIPLEKHEEGQYKDTRQLGQFVDVITNEELPF